jgi:PAS domain S-box-containing protein
LNQQFEGRGGALAGQMRVLEMVATGVPLEATLDELVGLIESQEEGLTCSILIVDDSGTHFRRGSGGRLPEAYHEALDGAPITPPYFGPCGEAAHLGVAINVPDIAADTSYAPEWRQIVSSAGLRSCVSIPVRGADGQVLASFAMYYRDLHDPAQLQADTVEVATHLAAIAIERSNESRNRDRIQRDLQESERRLGRELEASRQLQAISSLLVTENDVGTLYSSIIDAAIELMSSDAASMQLLEVDKGELRLLAWKGFHSESAAFWDLVSIDSSSTCGVALLSHKRVIVPDVEQEPFLAGSEDLDAYRLSQIRAVQTTPLISRTGRLLGMISTHWHQPKALVEAELGMLDALARQAADLIERTQAEAALRESERQSRELIQALPAAVYTTDTEGLITSYNEAAVALWGTRPDLGLNSIKWCGSEKIFTPDGVPLPLDQCPMAVTVKERRPLRDMEIIIERPDGSRVSGLPFPTPLFDNSGRFTGAIDMIVDLTELKRMEQSVLRRVHDQAALYSLTDRLYRAAELTDVYDAAIDAILATLRCNRASILLFDAAGVMRFTAWRGLSNEYRAAVDGHSPWKQGDRDPAPIFIENIDAADETTELINTIKHEGIQALGFIPLVANGTVIGKFMTYHETPHAFSRGEIDLAMNIARQLGFSIERNRAEEARRAAELELRENEERLRQILDSAKEYAIFTLDSGGDVTSWNEGAKRLLGFDEAEIIGQSGDIFFTPEDRELLAPERERAKARDEGRAANERWHVRKDGSRFWGSGVMLPLQQNGRNASLKIFRDRTQERIAEERQQLLINELNHRVKNTLATVQSVATQTLRGAAAGLEIRAALESRLTALARSHDVLTQENWEAAGLRDIVQRAIEPFMEKHGTGERFTIEGEDVRLSPQAALSLGMGLHELATNAAKYGALSMPQGKVSIRWLTDSDGEEGVVKLVWQEIDGPPVSPPKKKGFGSRLIEQALAYELDGKVTLDFAPGGVRLEVTLPQRMEGGI